MFLTKKKRVMPKLWT